jgi:hypothetical protein
MSTKLVTLYYDSYEKNYGDGFFPLTMYYKGYDQVNIGFIYSNSFWRQISGDNIHGLDGNERNYLLNILNDNKICCSSILNKIGMTI